MNPLYSVLMKVRPAFLAEIVKKTLGVKRRVISDKWNNRFWVDPVSHFGFELISTKEYEPILSKFIQDVLGPQDTVVDVGANEGYFSVLAGKIIKTGRVLAFEPQQRLVDIIVRNAELNSLNNVVLFPIALSDSIGEAVFHLSLSTNTGSSSFYKSWKSPTKKQRVNTNSLDECLLQQGVDKVRLIKIDCEGGEIKVVPGLLQSLRRGLIDMMLLEYHEGIIGWEQVRKLHRSVLETGYILSRTGLGLWVYHKKGLEKELLKFGTLDRVELDERGNFIYKDYVPTQTVSN